MPKQFYELDNVGHARYTVNFHDGVQTHKDGSRFYGIRIFSNKQAKAKFVSELQRQGYLQE